MDKRYTWVVRFDVAPEWVADGFVMTDETALDMLSDKVGFANMETELAARVIAAPSALDIAKEQGYTVDHPVDHKAVEEIKQGAPLAYQYGKGLEKTDTLEKAMMDAISLLDSVAFVRDENDNTGAVLSKLRAALCLVRGDEVASDEG